VIDRLEALGMTVRATADVGCRIDEQPRLFARYGRYWANGRPAFCRVYPPTY
jgi:hypothetical protein